MDKLKDYITINLIYAGMSKEEYKLIQCDVQEENRNSLMTFSAITVVFLLIMFCVSLVSVDVSTNRYVYMPEKNYRKSSEKKIPSELAETNLSF